MGQNGWDKIKNVLKSWELGDYFRQFSIVAAGIIVTFWGSDKIAEHSAERSASDDATGSGRTGVQ